MEIGVLRASEKRASALDGPFADDATSLLSTVSSGRMEARSAA